MFATQPFSPQYYIDTCFWYDNHQVIPWSELGPSVHLCSTYRCWGYNEQTGIRAAELPMWRHFCTMKAPFHKTPFAKNRNGISKLGNLQLNDGLFGAIQEDICSQIRSSNPSSWPTTWRWCWSKLAFIMKNRTARNAILSFRAFETAAPSPETWKLTRCPENFELANRGSLSLWITVIKIEEVSTLFK